jgi:Cu(I)/Ag(I) efflux system protein CusF
MKALMTIALASTILASAPFHAVATESHSSHSAAPADTAAATPMSDGEIRKVDKDAGKITIRHGELKNLDMPPMTMVFRVQDPALLDQVEPGDKVKFIAEKIGGRFTVVKLETLQ